MRQSGLRRSLGALQRRLRLRHDVGGRAFADGRPELGPLSRGCSFCRLLVLWLLSEAGLGCRFARSLWLEDLVGKDGSHKLRCRELGGIHHARRHRRGANGTRRPDRLGKRRAIAEHLHLVDRQQRLLGNLNPFRLDPMHGGEDSWHALHKASLVDLGDAVKFLLVDGVFLLLLLAQFANGGRLLGGEKRMHWRRRRGRGALSARVCGCAFRAAGAATAGFWCECVDVTVWQFAQGPACRGNGRCESQLHLRRRHWRVRLCEQLDGLGVFLADLGVVLLRGGKPCVFCLHFLEQAPALGRKRLLLLVLCLEKRRQAVHHAVFHRGRGRPPPLGRSPKLLHKDTPRKLQLRNHLCRLGRKHPRKFGRPRLTKLGQRSGVGLFETNKLFKKGMDKVRGVCGQPNASAHLTKLAGILFKHRVCHGVVVCSVVDTKTRFCSGSALRYTCRHYKV
eukprot:m.428136 g.428136  ORF g.428136 m.428136 type:complete len:450 (+) comp20231_c1_seq11:1470-2819(+)